MTLAPAPQIIKIKLDGKPVVLIPNNVAPSTLLAERLARGFAKQGAIITSNADNQLTLTITQLQAEVTKPGFVYKSRVNVKVSLKAENNGAHITKGTASQPCRAPPCPTPTRLRIC